MDQQGNPVCSEMWPGNASDPKSLVPIVERLQTRFPVGQVCIVADRGRINADTPEQIRERKWQYILGVRMRSSKEAKEEVMGRAGRYHQVHAQSIDPQAPAPLKVKEVWVEQRRYVVCQNEEQAEKDRQEREAIAVALKDALQGATSRW